MEAYVLYFVSDIGAASIKGVFDTAADAMAALNSDFVCGREGAGHYYISRALVGAFANDPQKNIVFSKHRRD
jgi:hypothetical protein